VFKRALLPEEACCKGEASSRDQP